MGKFRLFESSGGDDVAVDMAPVVVGICFIVICLAAGKTFIRMESGKTEGFIRVAPVHAPSSPQEKRRDRMHRSPDDGVRLTRAMARVDEALELAPGVGAVAVDETGSAKPGMDADLSRAREMLSVSEPERAPRLIGAVKPDYPSELRQHEMTGRVLVAFLVTPEGRVTDVRIEQSANAAFDASAVAAVRQWRFEPARKGGKAVAVRMRIPIAFRP